jgi:hypothetical protein
MTKSRLLFLGAILFALGLTECTNADRLTSIQLIPNSPIAPNIGDTVQFKAIGNYQRPNSMPGQIAFTKDLTTQVTWASSTVAVATINGSGLATAEGGGITTITASMQAPLGAIVGTASLDCCLNVAVRKLTSLRIIPGSMAAGYVGEFMQMMAIGIYNTEPRVQDVTTQVHWESSDARIASVDSTGLSVAADAGEATITASARSGSEAMISASTRLIFRSADVGDSLRAVTVFDAGLGSGTIVSDPPGIQCTPAGGCDAKFATGIRVTFTAFPSAGSTFGGWSANCLPNTSATCTLVVRNNEPIGVIFH